MAAIETTETFEAELTAAARLDVARNPFVAAIVAGRCSRDAIRRYAAATYALSDHFPQRLAAAASIVDDPEVRLALLENLLEEEGVVALHGNRLIRDDAKRHGNVALRFAIAAGATEDDLRAAREHDRVAAPWLAAAIARKSAAAAVAFLTVGIESNVPATLSLIAESLSRHYGFAAHDLEFLESHVAFDASHGAAGARLTARLACTAPKRDEALEGARRGALAWWGFHRSFCRMDR